MLFESRRILIGFRLKIKFDEILKQENSYIYVNVFKTSTVGELTKDIRSRFHLFHKICLMLDDCHLLESEDVSVLADASEVKVIPEHEVNSNFCVPNQVNEVLLSNNVTEKCIPWNEYARTYASNSNTNQRNILHNFSNSVANYSNTCTQDNVEKERYAFNNQSLNNVCDSPDISTKNHKMQFTSLSEALRLIREKDVGPESYSSDDNLYSVSNQQQLEAEKVALSEQNNENPCECNENNYDENLPVDNSNDDCIDLRKKRKRKRKHTKKSKNLDTPVLKAHNSVNHIDTSSAGVSRKHVFFNDEEYESSEKFEKDEVKSESIKNETINSSSFDSNSVSNPNLKNITFDFPVNNFNKIDYNENFEKNSPQSASFSNDSSKDTNHLNIDQIPSYNQKNDQKQYPLQTLLMCKQLKTCVEYSIQYPEKKAFSHINSSANGNILDKSNDKVKMKLNNIKADCEFMNSTELNKTNNIESLQGSRMQIDNNSENECQVIRQYKIKDDKIHLCEIDGTWRILTSELCDKILPPVQEPVESQVITFQMLYLSANLCPTVSELMCGTIIKVIPGSHKIAIHIARSFINKLLQDSRFSENQELPEELTCITGDAYGISWLSIKNPRRLM